MTYQEVLKQTETFTTEQKQQLAYYCLFSSMKDEDKKQYANLFHYKDNIKEDIKTGKRIWNNKGTIKLNDTLDNINIRDFIYNDEFYNDIVK